MKEWLLSNNLIGLDGMPSEIGSISARARREKWKSRKAKTGGRSMEYHISNFEPYILEQLKGADAPIHITNDKDQYVCENIPTKYTEWFLGADLLEIQGLPNSIRGMSQKAKRDGWKKRKSSTGKAYEYHISSFHENIQDHLKNLFSKNDGNDQDDLTHNVESELHYGDIIDYMVSNGENEKIKKFISSFLTPPNEKRNMVDLDFFDVEVSAGHGTLVIQEEQRESISFSRKFIENELGVNTQNIFLMPIRGDSMHPTLKNKSIIMVNRVADFSGDGIYVFRYNSLLMVKRLQFTKTGLTIVSDNTSYKEWDLNQDELETEDFEIIGEIVWSGQRI